MDRLTLKVDSVQLSFYNHKILQDVYLSCNQGEIIGLLGRNGCGKSSLLKVIFGLLTPGHKYVAINDEFIHCGYLKSRMAYLPQHNYLPKGIKIRGLAKMHIDPLFWDEFTSHPIYAETGHKKIGELSGGEQRMLEILMVVYNQADFILLDEPFTHISPVQTEQLKPILKSCGQRKGIIITDHLYAYVLDVSDRIILLNNGGTKHIKHVDELATYGYISGT